jgi:hypothetical protein
MRIGRRPLFFFAIALTFLVMYIPTPEEFRSVNVVMAALAAFWATLLTVEELVNRPRRPPRNGPEGGRP